MRSVYDHAILVDTSAAIALFDPQYRFHQEATEFFNQEVSAVWATLDVTAHEAYTRSRYAKPASSVAVAFERFDFLRTAPVHLFRFTDEDESSARAILEKYGDQRISYHDALCGALMLRIGMYRIFAFDRDFWVMGFQVVPGITA